MTNTIPSRSTGRYVPKFRRQAGRRDLMIDSALEVFFDKGYERARIEDVARLAGVGKSAVLYHFRSKLALLVGVVAKHCLPAAPLAAGTADQVIEASLADPAAAKVMRLVLTEQRRLPSLGRLYLVAVLRRAVSWQGPGGLDAVGDALRRACGSMAARILFDGYLAKGEVRDGSHPV